MNINEEERESYRKFRKNRFDFEVKLSSDYLTNFKEMNLSISPNGSQYFTVSFTKDEWKRIKKEIDRVWKENPS